MSDNFPDLENNGDLSSSLIDCVTCLILKQIIVGIKLRSYLNED